jgi:hypothetical protein
MLYIKSIVMGAGLSCVLLSAPILVQANIVETKTFKNNVPGGTAGTDLKITSNRHPFAARSDKFDFGDVDGNDIKFRGGSIAQGEWRQAPFQAETSQIPQEGDRTCAYFFLYTSRRWPILMISSTFSKGRDRSLARLSNASKSRLSSRSDSMTAPLINSETDRSVVAAFIFNAR